MHKAISIMGRDNALNFANRRNHFTHRTDMSRLLGRSKVEQVSLPVPSLGGLRNGPRRLNRLKEDAMMEQVRLSIDPEKTGQVIYSQPTG